MSNHSWLHYTAGSIFGIVAVAHLVRAFLLAPVFIGTWFVPLWISWIGGIVLAMLSGWLFKTA